MSHFILKTLIQKKNSRRELDKESSHVADKNIKLELDFIVQNVI
jgi:hypothetical protein